MITVITDGEVYAPKPRGKADVLLLGDRIARVGSVNLRAAEELDDEHHGLGARHIMFVEEVIVPKGLRYYVDHDGDPSRLTVSSDAGKPAPGRAAAAW